VFDPRFLRKILLELALGSPPNMAFAIEHDSATAGRALIDSKQMTTAHEQSLFVAVIYGSRLQARR
jgi:hypothetical protein